MLCEINFFIIKNLSQCLFPGPRSTHCVKSPNTEFFLVQMPENTNQKKTPYLDTFHAVTETRFLSILHDYYL